jgi:NAD(P)-dependent dehydrogenase (short-subunit alcohol dehydrogenase family)
LANQLDGKVAIVTGGASGIGKAIAARYAAEGAAVVVADLNAEDGSAVASEIVADGGKAVFQQTDVTRAADCERAVATALDRFGRLNIMVNSAGIGAGAPVAELEEVVWDAVLGVNLKGVFLGTKYAFPALARSGGGLILNLASIAGLVASPGFAAYGASKAGVIQLTKVTALEGASFQIRANALCPTWVDTPLVERYLQQMPDPAAAQRAMTEAIPLGRLGTTDDVAGAALYLASDAAAFISGVALPIDGAMIAGAAGNLPARRRTTPAETRVKL